MEGRIIRSRCVYTYSCIAMENYSCLPARSFSRPMHSILAKYQFLPLFHFEMLISMGASAAVQCIIRERELAATVPALTDFRALESPRSCRRHKPLKLLLSYANLLPPRASTKARLRSSSAAATAPTQREGPNGNSNRNIIAAT